MEKKMITASQYKKRWYKLNILYLLLSLFYLQSCMNNQEKNTNTNEITMLTSSDMGHTLHHNNAFSKDDEWIVFDGRNDDTKIGETATIGVVHVETGEEKIIYQTQHQTIYGPGVGAVSFSPTADRVIFIHGLTNADSVKPYDMSRRIGVGIDIDSPLQAFHYDARDVVASNPPGSVRGGTH